MFIFTEQGNIVNSRYISSIVCIDGVDVYEDDCWLACATIDQGREHGQSYLFRANTEEEVLKYISDLKNTLNVPHINNVLLKEK